MPIFEIKEATSDWLYILFELLITILFVQISLDKSSYERFEISSESTLSGLKNITLALFAIPTHSLFGPRRFLGTLSSIIFDEIALKNPSFWSFQRFPASAVKNMSADVFSPSDLILSMRASPLPEIIFTLMPVASVKFL